jgi:RHS repeat-associated protein
VDFDVDDLATQMTQGSDQVRFAYSPGGARYRRVDLQNGVAQKTTRYIGNVEIVIGNQCETKRYIGGALILIDQFANNLCSGVSTKNYHYQFADHLGSLDVLTTETGAIRERFSFSAHGERRASLDWQGNGLASVATTRGFTGHEHVDSMGLIHMNARLYDAQLGRFIQADPIIQDTLNAQNLNRYSYVLNNPLSLTDPSGASWFSRYWRTILSLAINIFLPGAGAFWTALGVGSSMGIAVITGFISGVISSGSLKGGLWSAFSAGLFSKIGSYFEGAKWAQASGTDGILKTGLNAGGYAAKVLSHGVAGGVMQSLQGGKFGHGFVSAGVAQAASGMIDGIDPSNVGFSPSRTFAAAMLGGSVSAATGGKFASGAATAAFSRAFNDDAHYKMRKATRDVETLTSNEGESLTDFAHRAGQLISDLTNAGKVEHTGALTSKILQQNGIETVVFAVRIQTQDAASWSAAVNPPKGFNVMTYKGKELTIHAHPGLARIMRNDLLFTNGDASNLRPGSPFKSLHSPSDVDQRGRPGILATPTGKLYFYTRSSSQLLPRGN